MDKDKNLDKLFNPKSIAIIGATSREGSVGKSIMQNLLGNYEGMIFPINPKRKSIMGVKAYSSVIDVPDDIDMAIIAIPAKFVPGVVEEAGKKGIKGLVIISAGFSEAGKEGKNLVDKILRLKTKYGFRILGPNCLGFINPHINLNASFASKTALKGDIAFISQSGALCTAILDWSTNNNIGFSNFISIGSMIDVGFHDLIEYFGQDPKTKSILIYMESLGNAKAFMSAARSVAMHKPIIIMKVGKSSAGAKAARSHTGSISGNDLAYETLFRRAGIIRANTIQDLFNYSQILSSPNKPKGNRLAIVTNAGGPGVITTDFLIEQGGRIAKLSKSSYKELSAFLPATWSHNNPVDVLGDATAERYKKAVEIVIKDKNVDGVLIILTPQAMTNPKEVAQEILDIESDKPIVAAWMGAEDVKAGIKLFEKAKVPVFDTPEKAVSAFLLLSRYQNNLKHLYETPEDIPGRFKPGYEQTKAIIQKALSEKRDTLTEVEAKEVLMNYGIGSTDYRIAKRASEAGKHSKSLGFPVVMKILSKDILHKTDIGGVRLNIKSEKEAEQAYREIMKNAKSRVPGANIKGVLIERHLSKDYELIIGAKKDPLFGPIILFGYGGIYVELFKDINSALPPLNMALAQRLIENTKVYKLLKGFRGKKGIDIEDLKFTLYKFSYLLADFPQIKELDINPYAIDKSGGAALDAKIIIENVEQDDKYGHLIIKPYPKNLELKTKFGKKQYLFRPIKPEDEPKIKELFYSLSDDTKKKMFFHRIKSITHDNLVKFCQIDYDKEITIVIEHNKKIVGMSRIVKKHDSAEFSILVHDKHQNQGLGTKLTSYIIDIAKTEQVKKIYAIFTSQNKKVRHIFEKKGFEIVKGKTKHRAVFIIENYKKN
jgi:acetyltransferase